MSWSFCFFSFICCFEFSIVIMYPLLFLFLLQNTMKDKRTANRQRQTRAVTTIDRDTRDRKIEWWWGCWHCAPLTLYEAGNESISSSNRWTALNVHSFTCKDCTLCYHTNKTHYWFISCLQKSCCCTRAVHVIKIELTLNPQSLSWQQGQRGCVGSQWI